MSMLVRVTTDDDGPIAVKTATSDDDRARLGLESQRLRRAGHPGLVAVVGADGPSDDGLSAGGELRTRFAGDPVSQWTGSLAHVAGLGAAVAATLADLHEMGIVHGHIDASHVLVGHDGRPRLCGLSHAGDARASDDVQALGRVLHDLLRRLPPERRRLGRLGSRARGDGDRRALDRVIARALDPVATRRPRADTLAASILHAVPGAALPDHLDVPPPGVRSAWTDPDPVEHDDQLLQIVLAHEKTDDERWADAFGHDPGVDAADSSPDDGPWAAGPDPEPPPGDDTLPLEPSGWQDSFPSPDPTWRLAPQRFGRPAADPATARGRRGVPRARRRRLSALLGTGGVFVVGTIAAAVLVGMRPDAPASPTSGPSAAGSVAVPAAPDCPGVAPPAADVDGDGCAESVVVDGGTISAGTDRWTLGGPGDLAAVGDWDCDGAASPALLRPATGDVFVFRGWAAHDRPVTVAAAGNVGGSIGIRAQHRADGCDDLLLDLPSGSATTVAVPS
ncbi:MAG: hypothetical protein ACRDZN_05425 [Acidimicrobiales bacterium]